MIINRFIVVQTTYESTQRVMLSLSIDNPYRRVPKGVIKIARSTLSKWVSCVKGSYRRDSSTVRYTWRPRRVCRSFWISVKVTIGIINQLPSRYRSSRSRLNHSWTESIGDQGRNISLAKKKNTTNFTKIYLLCPVQSETCKHSRFPRASFAGI